MRFHLKVRKFFGIMAISLFFIFSSAFAISENSGQSIQAMSNISSMPLAFTQNNGQWPDSILFRANAGGATMWFTKAGSAYQFTRSIPKDDAGLDDPMYPMNHLRDQKSDSIESIAINAFFIGANPNPQMVGSEMMEYKCNYFIGNDPNNWHTDVPNYNAIIYEEIYSGIDLKYYGNGKQMEYDFIVSPGADPAQIAIHYEGAESLSVNVNGELVVETAWGEVVEQRPIVYQLQNGVRESIDGEYVLTDRNSFGFSLGGNYDPALPLVIDPVLTYSTYLGGSGYDMAFDVAADAQGNAHIVGLTLSSDFPYQNPLQGSYGGSGDVFITKLNYEGNALIYSTFLGGNSADTGISIAVDAGANVYVAGRTASSDFPTENPLQSMLSGSEDSFVAKLNSMGNTLVYCTYLGGSGNDKANGIAVDEGLNACITGYTNSINFPTANPIQETYGGGDNDVFIVKLDEIGTSLIYSTYLGGNNNDRGRAIAVDDEGNAYITGNTYSSNFPTQSAFQAIFGGSWDAILAKIDNLGNSLIYSTYIGGSNGDMGLDIAVDDENQASITGYTKAYNFPTENPFQATYGGGEYDAFITKFSATGNTMIYSTFLGGSSDDIGNRIAVDGSGCAHVTGYTGSSEFPTQNAYDASLDGNNDVFVTKFSASGNTLIYSTFLGGSSDDIGYGIAVDGSGCAYVTGNTYSSDFPTQNAYDASLDGSWDVFVTKLNAEGMPPSFCDGFDGLFCDDFEDGIITDWQSLRNDGCSWAESNGILSTSISGMEQWCIQTVGDHSWANYSLEAKVIGNVGINEGVDKVLVFRIQDADNFYTVNLRSDYPSSGDDFITFDKMVGGVYQADVVTESYPSEIGVWYTLRVNCIGNYFQVYVDDNLALEYVDPDNLYPTGGIGVACWTGYHGFCDISFDNVTVLELGSPHIDVNPASLEFMAIQNGAIPNEQTVTIGNTGSETLAWSVESDQFWLDITPSSGIGNSAEVTVSPNTTNLAPDNYNATITVSGNADNTPQTISVSYQIDPDDLPDKLAQYDFIKNRLANLEIDIFAGWEIPTLNNYEMDDANTFVDNVIRPGSPTDIQRETFERLLMAVKLVNAGYRYLPSGSNPLPESEYVRGGEEMWDLGSKNTISAVFAGISLVTLFDNIGGNLVRKLASKVVNYFLDLISQIKMMIHDKDARRTFDMLITAIKGAISALLSDGNPIYVITQPPIRVALDEVTISAFHVPGTQDALDDAGNWSTIYNYQNSLEDAEDNFNTRWSNVKDMTDQSADLISEYESHVNLNGLIESLQELWDAIAGGPWEVLKIAWVVVRELLGYENIKWSVKSAGEAIATASLIPNEVVWGTFDIYNTGSLKNLTAASDNNILYSPDTSTSKSYAKSQTPNKLTAFIDGCTTLISAVQNEDSLQVFDASEDLLGAADSISDLFTAQSQSLASKSDSAWVYMTEFDTTLALADSMNISGQLRLLESSIIASALQLNPFDTAFNANAISVLDTIKISVERAWFVMDSILQLLNGAPAEPTLILIPDSDHYFVTMDSEFTVNYKVTNIGDATASGVFAKALSTEGISIIGDDSISIADINPGDSLSLNFTVSVDHISAPSSEYMSFYFDATAYPENGIGIQNTVLLSALTYICGDVNADGNVNLIDILYLIDYKYGTPQGNPPIPMNSGDINADGAINLIDILYLIDYLYGTPAGPDPECP